ncbi:hypothetical protein [Pseudomonas sp. NPDC096950]|uniref:hypothetical protein n=1 Tax=Pseudomonas sp. NPDC096950 TaxID=3364485 RepID=UPI00383B1A21
MKKLLFVMLCAGLVSGCATEKHQEETNALLRNTNNNLQSIQLQLVAKNSVDQGEKQSQLIKENICFLDDLAYSKGAVVVKGNKHFECVESFGQQVQVQVRGMPPLPQHGFAAWKVTRAKKGDVGLEQLHEKALLKRASSAAPVTSMIESQ